MRVVSGSMGREIVHPEAPPSDRVMNEMREFLRWWNNPVNEPDGVLRAAIAHFRFVTIHPFEDGNGRISRALTDMALAQDEKTGMRLYSLSSQIIKDKSEYYRILEKTQKGRGDITEWLIWFLTTLEKSIENSKRLISKTIFLGRYYRSLSDIHLRERQLKVLKKMLDRYPEEFQGGLTNRKYVAMTNVSSETAKRDLKEMLDKGLIIPGTAGGTEPRGGHRTCQYLFKARFDVRNPCQERKLRRGRGEPSVSRHPRLRTGLLRPDNPGISKDARRPEELWFFQRKLRR